MISGSSKFILSELSGSGFEQEIIKNPEIRNVNCKNLFIMKFLYNDVNNFSGNNNHFLRSFSVQPFK